MTESAEQWQLLTEKSALTSKVEKLYRAAILLEEVAEAPYPVRNAELLIMVSRLRAVAEDLKHESRCLND